jgi:hypothetical protein
MIGEKAGFVKTIQVENAMFQSSVASNPAAVFGDCLHE